MSTGAAPWGYSQRAHIRNLCEVPSEGFSPKKCFVSKRKLGSKPMACARTGAEASPSGSENVNAAMAYLDRRSFLLYTPNMKKIGGNAKTLMLIPPPSIPRAF